MSLSQVVSRLKLAVFLFVSFVCASAVAYAEPLTRKISEVECKSFMRTGFASGDEVGTFTYMASPLRVEVKVDQRVIVITDATQFCTLPVNSSYGVPALSAEENSNGNWIELRLSVRMTPATGSPWNENAGVLSLNSRGGGSFTCRPYLDGDIRLTNCSIKYQD